MREIKTEKINENEYQVTQLPATKATNLLAFLLRKFAPFLALGTLDKQSLLDFKLDPSVLEGIMSALNSLSEQDVERVIKDMVSVTRVNNMELKGIYEDHFRGRMKEQLLWLKFALHTQFADFFE